MLRHVLCQTLQVQRFLTVHLGEKLAVGRTVVIRVLTQINHHGNFTSCHNSFSFLFFIVLDSFAANYIGSPPPAFFPS